MSGEKRPPHEVIMEAIADGCVTLKTYSTFQGPTDSRLRQAALDQIEILCSVLERMIIPEEHREGIITRLHGNGYLYDRMREAAERLKRGE